MLAAVEGGEGAEEKLDPLDSESGRLQHQLAKMRAAMRKVRAEMDEEKSALQERIAILKQQRAKAWQVDEGGDKATTNGDRGSVGGDADATTSRWHWRRRDTVQPVDEDSQKTVRSSRRRQREKASETEQVNVQSFVNNFFA